MAFTACAGQPTPALPTASEIYNAQTTYAKLVADHPFIRIASADVPADVRALTDLAYLRRGERELALDLYLPRQPTARPRPAIVLVHGGGWRSGERSNLAPLAIALARRGVAAAVVSYRLSGEARYPAAIHDVKAALRWLRQHAVEHRIDPDFIAVGGGSAGGQIASLVGVTNGDAHFDPQAAESPMSSAAQAIVNIDGLSDFTSEAARLHEDDPRKNPSAAGAWFGGRYADKIELWREASPLSHVGPGTPPMLFVISAQPRFSLGYKDMVAKLGVLGIPSRVVQIPDTPHSFWLFEPWLAPTVEVVAEFLNARFLDAHLARQP